MLNLFKKSKDINFDLTLNTDLQNAWDSWASAEKLATWWGPNGVDITRCEMNLVEGGQVFVTMRAGASMGKYEGTEWPMEGTIKSTLPHSEFVIDAQSWTEGQREETLIEHTISVKFVPKAEKTQMLVNVRIHRFGPKARMAAYGMKFGYKAQFKKLADSLS